MTVDDDDDTLLCQFLAFTGSSDPNVARQYLEMCRNQLEMAVDLFMDHHNTNGGGARSRSGDFGGASSPEVRAPDVTRSMRLVGGPPSPGRGDDAASAAALMAAVGGPNAAQMMMMGMMGGHGGGDDMMANTWASRDLRETVNRAASSRSRGVDRHQHGRNRSASGGSYTGDRNIDRHSNSRRRRTGSRSRSSSSGNVHNSNNHRDSDDEVQVVDEDGNIVGEVMEDDSSDDEYHYNDDESDDDSMGGTAGFQQRSSSSAAVVAAAAGRQPPSLSTMFQPPTHLVHRAGGFLGAKNFAKDARRWLLVNIQSDDDFACHALNRDVWHDELVENLVREGFVLWQEYRNQPEGMTYVQRYKVDGYPHIAIIDPRTGSLLYRKEGWTQVNPLTAEQFVEIASDFCSRHSFSKLPMPARHGYAGGNDGSGGGGGGGRPAKRPVHELSEQEQLEAAIRASMEDAPGGGDHWNNNDDDDDEVQVLENDHDDTCNCKDVEAATDGDDDDNNNSSGGGGGDDDSKLSPFEKEILSMTVTDEPTTGNVARVQLRMPDGKRLVRKFDGNSPVKVIYAFVAQSNDEARRGKPFELKAKFPPVDLLPSAEESISTCGLSGEAITFLWK